MMIISLIIFISSAVCEKPVTYLKEKEKTPCTGYLFSPEKEQELRLINERQKLLLDVVDTQDLLIKKNNERLTEYQEYTQKLERKIESRKQFNFWINSAYFIFGAVLTGTIATNL